MTWFPVLWLPELDGVTGRVRIEWSGGHTNGLTEEQRLRGGFDRKKKDYQLVGKRLKKNRKRGPRRAEKVTPSISHLRRRVEEQENKPIR